MSAAIAALSVVCLAAGAFFVVVGCIGLVRMPDLYTRMHAASVTDTLGTVLVIAGLALASGFNLVSAKLVLLGLLIFLTSPTATHALAQAALARDPRLLKENEGPCPPRS
jgi:multicomponent Na+:H+ antiporter subunit G